jgi:hypothetical protein
MTRGWSLSWRPKGYHLAHHLHRCPPPSFLVLKYGFYFLYFLWFILLDTSMDIPRTKICLDTSTLETNIMDRREYKKYCVASSSLTTRWVPNSNRCAITFDPSMLRGWWEFASKGRDVFASSYTGCTSPKPSAIFVLCGQRGFRSAPLDLVIV